MAIDETRKGNLSFNYVLKKIVWFEITKIILFIFSKGIGKNNIKETLNKLVNFDHIDPLEDDSLNNGVSKCVFCVNIATNVVQAKCGHFYCYYCFNICKNESRPCKKCFKLLED